MPRSTAARAPRASSRRPSEDVDALHPLHASAARVRQLAPLRDLDVAPENLRAGEPADADIPVLADTLFAAGQLQPLTVRPGAGDEKPFMALDGRRRLLALRLLVEQGRITDGFLTDVFVETETARQAAAVVLTNTAAPVHIADVIAAIGRMLVSGLEVGAIARALGYAELEIKRLARLSALPPDALEALKFGRITLKQARLLARLSDREEQIAFARMALDGHGLPDWRITEKLDGEAVNAGDPRYILVGADRYAAAGGRTETDLFGERPAVLLDPSILTDAWMARAREIALAFELEGLAVHVTAGETPELPDDLEPAGYVYGGHLPAAEMAAYREARSDHEAAQTASARAFDDGEGAEVIDAVLTEMIRARLAMDRIALGGRAPTALVFSPAWRHGLQVSVWAPVETIPPAGDQDHDNGREEEGADADVFAPPHAEAADPEVEGIGHGLHALRTEVATRGLIRALADDPRVALTALIARLFSQAAVRAFGPRGDSALAINARTYSPAGGRVIEALDGVVRERLDARRAQWEATGLTLIAWVHGLEDDARLTLLAELTALSLDVSEAKTNQIRRGARAEAAELAALSGADLSRHWTPDGPFLAAHSKPLLLGMLEAMQQSDLRAAALKKTELADLVARTAAEKRWVPAALSFAFAIEDAASEPAGDEAGDRQDEGSDPVLDDASARRPGAADEDAEDAEDDGDGGEGGFELTDAGRAALAESAA